MPPKKEARADPDVAEEGPKGRVAETHAMRETAWADYQRLVAGVDPSHENPKGYSPQSNAEWALNNLHRKCGVSNYRGYLKTTFKGRTTIIVCHLPLDAPAPCRDSRISVAQEPTSSYVLVYWHLPDVYDELQKRGLALFYDVKVLPNCSVLVCRCRRPPFGPAVGRPLPVRCSGYPAFRRPL